MTRYAFELSGEHETLPRSEVLALLDIYSSRYQEVCFLDQCLIVEADHLDVGAVSSRLAMAHRIIELLAVCPATRESLASAALEMDLPELESPKAGYRIRARGVKSTALTGYDVERAVGSVLHDRGFRADLKNPAMELRGIVTGNYIVLGRELARTDRSGFESRRPHLKPFFYPGVLMPRIARALVNLTRVRPGERLLDPFSGTAGILVEACLIGIKGVGVDVQDKLVRGATANLQGQDCTLLVGDAKRLPLADASVDAVVSDTPYGRSAVIRAESRETLLSESLEEIGRVLKPGRKAVVVADHPIAGLVNDSGLEIFEMHTERVHRSMTRYVFVCGRTS